MTRPEDTDQAQPSSTKAEIVQDKLSVEDILREEVKEHRSNPNDQPGFQDGVQGGWDGEDRQGEPNNDGDSDLEGRASGGTGTARSGGIDGGPARTTPLPGENK